MSVVGPDMYVPGMVLWMLGPSTTLLPYMIGHLLLLLLTPHGEQ